MRFVGCTEAAQNLHKLHRTPVLCTTPPSPIPPFSPKVASKRATQPPAPRINSTKSFLRKTKEKNKTDSPTTSKWQIGLFLWQKAARREPERSAASAKRAVTPHRQVQGRSPGTPLVTFVVKRKSPGCRAERLHWRSRDFRPCKISPGCGAQRPQIVGTQGPRPCTIPLRCRKIPP